VRLDLEPVYRFDREELQREKETAMKALAFQQVDVFTAIPFKGNPVAVVLDGDALSSEQMQAIAAWTNLSETTFVCTPTDQRADYRLRIFTPRRELPFAGHPTIGSAHAVLRRGFKPRSPGRMVQECSKGFVDIKIEGERLLLALPEPEFREPTKSHLVTVADGLGVSAAVCSGQRSSTLGQCGSPSNWPAATPSEPSRLTWASSRR
jgi:PhzF family phenazine biosynthesis protein